MRAKTETETEKRTWTETVAPIVRTLQVGAMTKNKVVYSPNGAGALGALITEMAERLDDATVLLEKLELGTE